MEFENVLALLRSRNETVPKPMRLPTMEEIHVIEDKIGFKFDGKYQKYLLSASDVVFGRFEPAQITIPNSHDYLLTIVENARQYGLPEMYLPICEDNGSFYCMDKKGKIFFWGVDYDGFTNESWEDIGDWIVKVWLEEDA